MAGPLFANNATATLAGSYSAAATDLTMTAGQGALFPSPGPSEFFMATIVDALNQIEIVKVTARASDTLTVVRGQEGTTARALGIGEKVEHRLTAGALDAIRDRPLDPSQIPNGTITTAMIADDAVTGDKIAPLSIYGEHITPHAVDGNQLATNAAVVNLGFTPVQQGGGLNWADSKIYISWTTIGKLSLKVDFTELGFILTERQDGSTGSAGYRAVPPHDMNSDYTFQLVDNGCSLNHGSGNNVYYVPSDGAVPFDRGSVVEVVNVAGGLTVAPDVGVTLTWLPSGATGPRALAAPGIARVRKVLPNLWYIDGHGLS